MLSRRSMVLGCGLGLAAGPALAVPRNVGVAPAWVPPARDFPGSLDALEKRLKSELGESPAEEKEIKTARAIIAATPTGVNPWAIGEFFLAVGDGEKNPAGQDWSPYTQEWPVRANPLIVSFFEATTYGRPRGDCTYWCAAFVSWCLAHSREGTEPRDDFRPLVGSARALDFQYFGVPTETPVRGDIIVFERYEAGKLKGGHVGFYDREDEANYYVLGGNQGGPAAMEETGEESNCQDKNAPGGKISIAPYRKNGSHMLHSFRTDPSLHDLGG